ncbi:hypothetical protein G5B40_07880 [Pikeienuella piscinae]|uniref:Capsule polysaccharide biosynthesis protein n=1 Tax=Pikeienuella piscinae TaxID=2748098 RepID=A0A7L5BW70_9RHOB|nr:hypothetical protein [Pikeienuella piscinae]QIE55383.1 hypothetical protein G5B40_07880 [Pikeienuella piscinae]
MKDDEGREYYGRFMSVLSAAQARPLADAAPRARVLAARGEPMTLCVRTAALRRGFIQPVQPLFPGAVSVESREYAAPATKILFGAILPEPKMSHPGAMLAMKRGLGESEILFAETAFIASTHSHLKFSEAPDVAGCLGTVYDDRAFYYMTDYPSRLIAHLNERQTLSIAAREMARASMRRIVSSRITKYNAQSLKGPSMPTGYARAVLVADQTVGDASVHFGRLDADSFDAMLRAACAENPDAAIIVKTHPDTIWSKNRRRAAYFAQLRDEGRIRVIREAINPFALFDLVDTVYVGSSQVGFEALFAGKKVICFGAPFYAGWGLTDDRQPVPHRRRTRTLEELFDAFCVWYPIYHLPGGDSPVELADALEFVERNRPVAPIAEVETPEPADSGASSAPENAGGLESFIALRKDEWLLRRSDLFDDAYYLARYPDVAAAGASPRLHYLRHGCAEGRDPSAAFSTAKYYAANADVRASGMNALVHYLRFGRDEGRAVYRAEPGD